VLLKYTVVRGLKWTELNTSLLSGVSISHQMKMCVDCFSVQMVTQGHNVSSWTSIFREEMMVPFSHISVYECEIAPPPLRAAAVTQQTNAHCCPF